MEVGVFGDQVAVLKEVAASLAEDGIEMRVRLVTTQPQWFGAFTVG